MTSKALKRGFTTGAAAAAAAKAALLCLLEQDGSLSSPSLCAKMDTSLPEHVDIRCLSDEWLSIKIHRVKRISTGEAEAIVIKDAGDDPDVTHKAEIGARVLLLDTDKNTDKIFYTEFNDDIHMNFPEIFPHITIRGGKGVGVVTKPGLEVTPGNPAINSGPRKMIFEAIETVLKPNATADNLPLPISLLVQKRIVVEIFVPEGEKLAEKTLNARLGILGGISILGTTGIVKPMSHDAYIATIRSGISVARAMGIDTLVFTTGRRSERFAMTRFPNFPEEGFIQIGDFFKASLGAATTNSREDSSTRNASDVRKASDADSQIYNSVKTVIITVFFGKAVKMAMGFPHTHAAKSELTMKKLSQWAEEITGSKMLGDQIAQANTARHAFSCIYPDFPELITHVGERIVESAKTFSQNTLNIRSIIFDFEGDPIFDSNVSG